MTKLKIAEQISVQIVMAQMMPANFSRQSIDALSILWELYNQPDPATLPGYECTTLS